MLRNESSRDRTLALAATIAIHAVALLALFVSSSRMASQPSAADDGSTLEATFVSMSPQPKSDPSNTPHSPHRASQPSPPKQPSVEPRATPSSQAAVADHPNPADSQALPDRSQSVATDTSQPNDSNSSQRMLTQTAPQPTDVQDPLAELRRMRAEAEHQRQMDGLAEQQALGARVRAVLTEAPGSGYIPTSPLTMADDRGQPQWFPVSYSTSYVFDADHVWAFAYDAQPTRCPRPLSRSRNDAADTAGWIDCLLDASTRNEATRTMHGMTLTTAGFAPTLASRTGPGFVTWR